MRKTNRSGSFLLCLLLNMLLNLEGLIPAAVLLALHFILKWSIWWAVLAAGLWIVYLILWMLFMRFAAKSSNKKWLLGLFGTVSAALFGLSYLVWFLR